MEKALKHFKVQRQKDKQLMRKVYNLDYLKRFPRIYHRGEEITREQIKSRLLEELKKQYEIDIKQIEEFDLES